jgi:hypothetical protein
MDAWLVCLTRCLGGGGEGQPELSTEKLLYSNLKSYLRLSKAAGVSPRGRLAWISVLHGFFSMQAVTNCRVETKAT